MGDVERVVAQGPGPRQDLADALGRDADLVEVDRAVHVVEAVRPALCHVQGRGEGRADADADEADEEGFRHDAPLS